jgi:hypothetical protein
LFYRFLTAVTFVAAGACITEPRGILSFNITGAPPDTTSASSVSISGDVVRSPPKQGLAYVVTVTGGAREEKVGTNNFGQFTINVVLKKDMTNVLVMTADDGTGSITQHLEFEVVQINPTAESAELSPSR